MSSSEIYSQDGRDTEGPDGRRWGNVLIGIVLVVVGLLFFAQTLGFISGETMEVLWPLGLVVLGLALLSHKMLGHDCAGVGCWCGGPMDWGKRSNGKSKRKR